MATLKEDIQKSAEWISTALISSGYKADFSTDSIAEVERFFSEQSRNGKAVSSGLLSEQLGTRLFSVGSYVGELLKRNIGGEWIVNDSDPQDEINVAVKLPNGTICWPVQRVMKRFKNGTEESLTAYAISLGIKTSAKVFPNK